MGNFKKKKLSVNPPILISQKREKIESAQKVGLSSGQTDKKPGRFSAAKSVLIGFFVLVSVFFAGYMTLKAFSLKNGDPIVGMEKGSSFLDTILQPKLKGTTNVLIAGVGGKGHDGGDLTDSIMLASLDADQDRATLVSIPRDLYVAYPGGKSAGRINALYDLGKRDGVGIEYLADKVAQITGQTIDEYIVIDFAGFKQVVDILGGIEIDVPTDLLDREYPNNNWGYEVFSVKKGLQTFNGERALKYARSRHSTSDFDRSMRQQLILKAIKEKAFSLGYITSPTKISELYNAVMSHLDTSLSVVEMGKYALDFKDIKTENIDIVSLNNDCASITRCQPGGFLYNPSRDLFGGAAVILPENAQVNRLSYYDDIQKFVSVTFRFPGLRKEENNVVIVTDPSVRARATQIGEYLAKLGIPFVSEKALIVSTGAITQSHINVYWHPDLKIGINPDTSATLGALKFLEAGIPVTQLEKNEYVTDSGPKIEIVLGKDIESYFTFVKKPYYLPVPTSQKAESSGATGGSQGTTEKQVPKGTNASSGSGLQTSVKEAQKETVSTTRESESKKEMPVEDISSELKQKIQEPQVGEWEEF